MNLSFRGSRSRSLSLIYIPSRYMNGLVQIGSISLHAFEFFRVFGLVTHRRVSIFANSAQIDCTQWQGRKPSAVQFSSNPGQL